LRARIELEHTALNVDLSRPVSIAIDLDFSAQPRHFGAPVALTRPWSVPGFSGSVAQGASCNCHMLTLIPHCNGTHTESVGHLTTDPLDAFRIVPPGLVPALLLSVEPVDVQDGESVDPPSRAGDLRITRRALLKSWPRNLPFEPNGLILRTLPNGADKKQRDYTELTAAYLTSEAAQCLVERGVQHLVVDLPSIDRTHDEGRLTAHRIFFGLPPGSRALSEATRSRATITEFAYIPNGLADGAYLLEIQTPAIAGDAVPSRPVLYALESLNP